MSDTEAGNWAPPTKKMKPDRPGEELGLDDLPDLPLLEIAKNLDLQDLISFSHSSSRLWRLVGSKTEIWSKPLQRLKFLSSPRLDSLASRFSSMFPVGCDDKRKLMVYKKTQNNWKTGNICQVWTHQADVFASRNDILLFGRNDSNRVGYDWGSGFDVWNFTASGSRFVVNWSTRFQLGEEVLLRPNDVFVFENIICIKFFDKHGPRLSGFDISSPRQTHRELWSEKMDRPCFQFFQTDKRSMDTCGYVYDASDGLAGVFEIDPRNGKISRTCYLEGYSEDANALLQYPYIVYFKYDDCGNTVMTVRNLTDGTETALNGSDEFKSHAPPDLCNIKILGGRCFLSVSCIPIFFISLKSGALLAEVARSPEDVYGELRIVDHLSLGEEDSDHLCYLWLDGKNKLLELRSDNWRQRLDEDETTFNAPTLKEVWSSPSRVCFAIVGSVLYYSSTSFPGPLTVVDLKTNLVLKTLDLDLQAYEIIATPSWLIVKSGKVMAVFDVGPESPALN